jgi:hypothetical protein
MGEDLLEGLFTRLWALQEVLLSDDIQFVQCDYSGPKYVDPRYWIDKSLLALPIVPLGHLKNCLAALAVSWVNYGEVARNTGEKLSPQFIQAFSGVALPRVHERPKLCRNFRSRATFGDIRRARGELANQETFSLPSYPNTHSIPSLATPNRRPLPSFFIDCFAQLEAKNPDSQLSPLLAAKFGRIQTNDIPDPTYFYLYDVVRLFHGPKLSPWRSHRC